MTNHHENRRSNMTAAQIQAEIELMRRMYSTRRCLNQPRRDAMIGWTLITIALGIPIIAAIIIIII